MVVFDGNTHACETCIKGHRSSTCKHMDRPLFRIQKKGRPATQCGHCRELRKRKQVLIRCACGAKDRIVADRSSGEGKGQTSIPAEASTAVQSPETPLSIPDHDDADLGCSCNTGGSCNCCIPRKNLARRRKKVTPLPHDETHSSSSASASKTLFNNTSRLTELPRIPPRHTRSFGGLPKSNPHGGSDRPHSNKNSHFAPYNHAYDATDAQSGIVDAQDPNAVGSDDTFGTLAPDFEPTGEIFFQDQLRALDAAVASFEPLFLRSELTTPSALSPCGCSDSCHCPGCAHHSSGVAPTSSAASSCSDPNACTACIECVIVSLPALLPMNTSLSIPDSYQTDAIDEWICQFSPPLRTSLVT